MEQKAIQIITKDMTIGDVVEKHPKVAEVMQEYGLHCFGCHVNIYETIEQGCLGHGMTDETINSMVSDINKVIGGSADLKEEKPPELHVVEEPKEFSVNLTDNAAKKVLEIMKNNGKEGHGLRFGVVPGGCSGFTYNLDFEPEPKENDTIIEKNGVRIFVDKKSTQFVNAVEIDYVEALQGAGFKISNPNATSSCGCGKSDGF